MIFASIMAGGRGTRFWPLSRRSKPKQFIDIHSGKPMIVDTIERIARLVPRDHISIITNHDQMASLKACHCGITAQNIVAEPCGRNTAACIGVAAIMAEHQAHGKPGVVVALPADHVIPQTAEFTRVIRAAITTASRSDSIVTIGIKPTYPETGYGYIEVNGKAPRARTYKAFKVKRFVEKPSLPKARRYLKQGTYYWNAGIFVFDYRIMLHAIEQYMPALYKGLDALRPVIGTSRFDRVLKTVYATLPSVSIDYGIMEQYTSIQLHIGDFGWNDVGSWRVAADLLKKDKHCNAGKGDVAFIDSHNSCVYSAGKQHIALVGVDDLIVVAVDDAVLITRKEAAQDVKKAVEYLEARKRRELL